MKIRVLMLFLCLLMLGGCSYIEPDAQYTVTALGCQRKNGSLELMIKLIDPQETKGGSAPSTFTVSGEGDTVGSAMNDIYSKLSKELSFGHCQLIVVADKADREDLREVLETCISAQVPLRCPIACSKELNRLLASKELSSGGDLAGLVRENAKHFGYGGHTALYEIKTALLVGEENFALPILTLDGEEVKVDGLSYFAASSSNHHLAIEQSIEYIGETSLTRECTE